MQPSCHHEEADLSILVSELSRRGGTQEEKTKDG
jgi:hypothetical protein